MPHSDILTNGTVKSPQNVNNGNFFPAQTPGFKNIRALCVTCKVMSGWNLLLKCSPYSVFLEDLVAPKEFNDSLQIKPLLPLKKVNQISLKQTLRGNILSAFVFFRYNRSTEQYTFFL